MGDKPSYPPDEHEPESEGVRIIGPDEAAEAAERGDVVQRRPQDAPKFGDRPSSPQGPRPTLRFPLSDTSEASDIERPRVKPTGAAPAGAGRPGAEAPVPPEEPEELPETPDVAPGASESDERKSLFSVGSTPPVSPPPTDPDSSGQVELPHWTEPATGEVPRVIIGDDVDEESEAAWAAMASNAPRWRDSSSDYDDADDLSVLADDDPPPPAGETDHTHAFDDLDAPSERGSSRPARPAASSGARRRSPSPGRATPPPSGSTPAAEPERNVPMAVFVGVAVAALALALFSLGPGYAMILVVAVLAAAAAELFTTIRRSGYQPAQLLGIVACVAFPLAAYWRGEAAYPLLIFLTIVFGFLWYLAGAGDEHPVMNLGVTVLGIAYVAGMGSFAALLLRDPFGHDGVSLLLAVALVAVAYDVGAFFAGRSFGATPLSPASPSKSWEGVAGGALAALLVSVIIVGLIGGISLFGDDVMNTVYLAAVVVLAGTLGDLSESLLKRDLGVKDMGSILPGHGGLLDRFDGILFALPAAYYLAAVLR